MGNNTSIEQINLEYRVKEKLLNKEYKKCLNDETREIECVKKALEKGNKDLARFHAQNVIRKKNEAAKILEYISQLNNKTNVKLNECSKLPKLNKNDIKLSDTGGIEYSNILTNNTESNSNLDEVEKMISKIALESDLDLENYLKITNTNI